MVRSRDPQPRRPSPRAAARPRRRLSWVGEYLEGLRHVSGEHHFAFCRRVGIKYGDYRALIAYGSPPPTLDNLLKLVRALDGNERHALELAYDMAPEESSAALEGLG